MLSYQSIVKKQEMTERVKRHPPAYRRKLNMAKRKNQKRRSKKYQVNNRQLKAKQDVSLEEAVTRAVDECIEEGILAEFLLKNKTEVIKVSIYEYDKEFEEKKLRKAEYEAGRQDGIEIGRQDGIEIGKRILLEKIIKKKLKKGKSTEQIADELEEDINIIQKVVEKLKSQI